MWLVICVVLFVAGTCFGSWRACVNIEERAKADQLRKAQAPVMGMDLELVTTEDMLRELYRRADIMICFVGQMREVRGEDVRVQRQICFKIPPGADPQAVVRHISREIQQSKSN
jgi:hypothetical protein